MLLETDLGNLKVELQFQLETIKHFHYEQLFILRFSVLFHDI